MPGPRALAPWQPWAALGGFAFLLHFGWEMLQFPLYAGMSEAPHGTATWMCLRATGGDVLIALAAGAAGTLVARSRLWIDALSRLPLLTYGIAGLTVALGVEYASVHAWGRWSYARSMPTVGGVGLAPMLQWIVVPMLTLWLVRRHLGMPHRSLTPTDDTR